jgi:hypothetical protein
VPQTFELAKPNGRIQRIRFRKSRCAFTSASLRRAQLASLFTRQLSLGWDSALNSKQNQDVDKPQDFGI